MDAAEEKLTALKKAYADIILGISKEAASRVMSSEKKSARYQHELKVAKEEAVRMLVRLKQMMDSQVREAEAVSLNQQQKIEVLEAQLQEAEDIVRDLREELREVQAELERLKTKNSHNLNDDAHSEEAPVENTISSYQSCENLPPIKSSIAFDAHSAYIGSRDLPSIIVRNKDPRLYRNGCTQRIRACDRNLLDRDLCLSEENREVKDSKNGGEQNEGSKILSDLDKEFLAVVNIGGFKSFSRKRKRAVRRRKSMKLLGGKQSCLIPKLDRQPAHSVSSDPISVNDDAHSDENSPKSGPTLSQDEHEPKSQLHSEKDSENGTNIMEIDGGKTMQEDKEASEKVLPLIGLTRSSEGLSSPNYRMDVEKVDVPSHGFESNSSDPANGLANQTLRGTVIKYTFQRKRKRQALSGNETCGSCQMEKKTGDGKIGDEKLDQTKPSLLKESAGDCGLCGSEANGEGKGQNGDKRVEHPKPSLFKESSGDRGQCGSEVNGSFETKKKKGKVQNGNRKLEKPNPSLLWESSRDQRRMAQVARQLLSLSEKRWRD